MKKLLAISLSIVMCLSLFSVSVYADGVSGVAKGVISGAGAIANGAVEAINAMSNKDNIKVKVLNVHDASGKLITSKTISFPDSKPIIINGRTMLPIRAVAEAVGYQVSWDGKEQKVTLKGYFGRTSNCNYQGKNQAYSLMSKYKEKYLFFDKNKGSSVMYDDDFNGFVKMALDGKLSYMEDYTEVYSDIKLYLNKTDAYCNLWVNTHGLFGTYRMNVAPQIINDRTYLPLRAVGEMMGLDVEWNGGTKTVTLSARTAG